MSIDLKTFVMSDLVSLECEQEYLGLKITKNILSKNNLSAFMSQMQIRRKKVRGNKYIQKQIVFIYEWLNCRKAFFHWNNIYFTAISIRI